MTHTSSTSIQSRIDELENEIVSLLPEDHEYDCIDEIINSKSAILDDSQHLVEELLRLREFKENVTSYNSDWDNGISFVKDYDQIAYVKEFVNEYVDFKNDLLWICVDWEATARTFFLDWSCLTLDGTEYWFQCN